MEIGTNNIGASNFKVKRQKFGIGALLFMVIFGAIFAGAGFFMYKSMQIDESWTRTQGKITGASSRISDGSTTYTPIVEYTVDGVNYQTTGALSSSAYPNVGSASEVAYNPATPNESKVVGGASSILFLGVFVVIGAVLVLLAPFLFIRSLKRSNKISNLVQTGQKLQGVITDIQSEGNNSSGYKIVVSATDNSGVVQQYFSDKLNGAAGLAMADFQNNPIPIDVYIDSTNPQHYYVDISDIPNLSSERILELIKTAVSRNQPQSFVANQPPVQPNPQNNIPLPPQVPPYN
jgi:hypothetical protein